MQTSFQTLMMADGTLAVDYIGKSTVKLTGRVSTLDSLYHTSEHNIQNSPKEEQSKFIFEDNYLEDSWGLHSSMLIETSPCTPKCILNITNSPNTSDQPTTFPLLPVDCEMYQLCWVSNSELSSIDQASFTEGFLPANLLPVVSNSAVEHISDQEMTSNCSVLSGSINLDRTDRNMNEISFSNSLFENEQEEMLIDPLAACYIANNLPTKT